MDILVRNEDGELYVGSSRVPLQALVTARARGESPKAIQQNFPSIPLSEVYDAIAYYLEHQDSLDAQFAERRRLLDELDARNRSQHAAFFDAMHERFETARAQGRHHTAESERAPGA